MTHHARNLDLAAGVFLQRTSTQSKAHLCRLWPPIWPSHLRSGRSTPPLRLLCAPQPSVARHRRRCPLAVETVAAPWSSNGQQCQSCLYGMDFPDAVVDLSNQARALEPGQLAEKNRHPQGSILCQSCLRLDQHKMPKECTNRADSDRRGRSSRHSMRHSALCVQWHRGKYCQHMMVAQRWTSGWSRDCRRQSPRVELAHGQRGRAADSIAPPRRSSQKGGRELQR
mmetsp:Transcript_133143/g.244260  ORF Transcript_133143/g.244260 Transcript_133143/m.244260 type:complete len:226 (-) Transcript_133143:322-999(-)